MSAPRRASALPSAAAALPARRVRRWAARLWTCESGASHIEYALIAGLAGTAMIGGYTTLAGGLTSFFTDLSGILRDLL
jgi:Flp pilus assembly pilin Flp